MFILNIRVIALVLMVFVMAETCGWGDWSEWGSCTDSCGSCGTKTSTRSCPSGCSCSGGNEEYTVCNTAPCKFPRDSCCTGYVSKESSGGVVTCQPQ